MEKFHEGGIVYHKATGYKCVVISINDNHTIKVRTEKDEEKVYYPQELETMEEVQVRNAAKSARANEAQKKKIRSYGF